VLAREVFGIGFGGVQLCAVFQYSASKRDSIDSEGVETTPDANSLRGRIRGSAASAHPAVLQLKPSAREWLGASICLHTCHGRVI
jgi:hypothetical protein